MEFLAASLVIVVLAAFYPQLKKVLIVERKRKEKREDVPEFYRIEFDWWNDLRNGWIALPFSRICHGDLLSLFKMVSYDEMTEEWKNGQGETLFYFIWKRLSREHKLAILRDHPWNEDGNGSRMHFWETMGWGAEMTEEDTLDLISLSIIKFKDLKSSSRIDLLNYAIDNPERVSETLQSDERFKTSLARHISNTKKEA